MYKKNEDQNNIFLMLVVIHFRLMYEIVFSVDDKPKVLSQVESHLPFVSSIHHQIYDRALNVQLNPKKRRRENPKKIKKMFVYHQSTHFILVLIS